MLSAMLILISHFSTQPFFAMQKHSKKQDAPFSRPFGATENDAQKLHALWLLPMIVVRNPAHEVFCPEKAVGIPGALCYAKGKPVKCH